MKRPLTNNELAFAYVLVAEGKLTDEEICGLLKVDLRILQKAKQSPHFCKRVAVIRPAIERVQSRRETPKGVETKASDDETHDLAVWIKLGEAAESENESTIDEDSVEARIREANELVRGPLFRGGFPAGILGSPAHKYR